MFEKPYFLFLLFLPAAFIFYKSRRYYLRHPYVKPLQASKTGFRGNLAQNFCTHSGWVLLVLASADLTWGTTVVTRRQPVHKYVLINDGSGSMVDRNLPRGVGSRLTPVYKGNESLLAMLDKRDDGSKDLVGAIAFSNEAFVVSYMVDEPQFVAKKLAQVDYTESPMGQGTSTEKAVWAAIVMVLCNDKQPEDLSKLMIRMYGAGHKYKTEGVEDVVNKYKQVAKNSCLIIFTDGEFEQPLGTSHRMSVYKELNLCRDLGIKVYVISVAQVDNLVEKYTADTGGFSVIFRDFEESKFRNAYEKIVQNQTQDEIIVEKEVKKFLSPIIAAISLVLLGTGLFLRLTFGRNFTEI